MSYEQKSHKDVGICGTYTTKMNFNKWHANTNLNLKKTQTSGTLSKDKELHQVNKSLQIKKDINKQEIYVVK